MTSELRDRQSGEDWLAAGLCLTRLVAPTEESLRAASAWVAAAHAEVGFLPPPGVVADFGALLLGGVREPCPVPASSDAKLREVVRSYEDQVLGRLSADPRLDGACDAVAKLPAHLKVEAVAVLISSFLARIDYRAGVAVGPGVTRGLSERVSAAIVERGRAHLRQPGEVLDTLVEGYTQLVRATRHAGAILTDGDLVVLENLTVLRSLAQRLALQQVAEVAAELEASLPRRLPRGPRRGSRLAARLEDPDTYPIGGFSSVSTSGSIENLVTSELIYMDDPAAREVDLFDLRYVENELLYYTRDESLFLRNRRVITFVLVRELTEARFKDPGVRWQRTVIVLGMLLCLVRRLSDWLSEEALLFRVVFADAAALAPERELCSLFLREWIVRGSAQVCEVASLAQVGAEAGSHARTAESDLLIVGMGRLETLALDPRVQTLALDLQRAVPVLQSATHEPPEIDPASGSWEGWLGLVAEIAQRLV